MKGVKLLDTTLRDGSYPINFSFNATDTSLISRELEKAGFHYIEIGHGIGLNASNQGYGTAAQTDEEYMIAAEEVLKKAKYGMFCIPGISEVKDIDLAADHNMGFIRIGTNVTEIPSSEEFIKRANEYDIFVTANFMKSYALNPHQLAEKVRLSESYGADVVYIVDSAGGMFTENIKNYYQAIRNVSDIALGFHGHDNLGLAVSNSIEAAKLGVEFIDSSLQGLGRSSGNASTELLLAALLKLGFNLEIDFLKVLDIGQNYIQPLLTHKGIMPLDVVSGYAEFHSSYMNYIQEYASKYQVRPEILIIEMCKLNKVDLDEELLKNIAKKIKKEESLYLGRYGFNKYIGREQNDRT